MQKLGSVKKDDLLRKCKKCRTFENTREVRRRSLSSVWNEIDHQRSHITRMIN